MLNVRYTYGYGRSLLSLLHPYSFMCSKSLQIRTNRAVPPVVMADSVAVEPIVQARHYHRTSGRSLNMAELLEERLREFVISFKMLLRRGTETNSYYKAAGRRKVEICARSI